MPVRWSRRTHLFAASVSIVLDSVETYFKQREPYSRGDGRNTARIGALALTVNIGWVIQLKPDSRLLVNIKLDLERDGAFVSVLNGLATGKATKQQTRVLQLFGNW
jgi:hypothetical protein